jgi:hypothetical protein
MPFEPEDFYRSLHREKSLASQQRSSGSWGLESPCCNFSEFAGKTVTCDRIFGHSLLQWQAATLVSFQHQRAPSCSFNT